MRFSNHRRLREQVRFLKRQFLQDGDLPFGDTLTNQIVAQAMTAVEGVWKDRIYSPLVTPAAVETHVHWDEPDCLLCGGDRRTPVIDAPDPTPGGPGLRFAVVRCDDGLDRISERSGQSGRGGHGGSTCRDFASRYLVRQCERRC